MSAPNNRASLLAGLRTGGVRAASGSAVPHTAAPGGSFQVPRFTSSAHQNHGYEDEEADQLADTLGQTLNLAPRRTSSHPLTAGAADAGMPRFQQQQQLQQQAMLRQAAVQRAAMNVPQQQFVNQMGMGPQAQAQAQLLQMWQMQQMQMQMMMVQQQQQQQQYQAELNAQAQRPAAHSLRAPVRQQQPSTAGPLQTSFTVPAPLQSRPQFLEQHLSDEPGPVPMTAALGGKFGSRSMPASLNAGFQAEDDYKSSSAPGNTPNTANYQHTTVISGGTSLGGMMGGKSTPNTTPNVTPSKSDSALSWRRGSPAAAVNNSVLRNSNLRSATMPAPPTVTVSGPANEDDDYSPPLPSALLPKFRPQPLRFTIPVTNAPASSVTLDANEANPTQTIAINNGGGSGENSSSSSSGSLPPTPPSATSVSSLSAREEASKKLYEGLGIGRPALTPQPHQQMQYGSPNTNAALVAARAVSQPLRQPRGPPSGTEDLGQKNFASRIRRQAIGGLGALMDARERRDGGYEVEAY